ncbi:hypothetical protein SAV14893_013790 [Streptomyces avermitilis]|uniref:Uncharacterized protein n=1 Tax=Streptomyces avermitilis TaxID=33903 RepID=A0A4D4LRJ2_STRAX|nr:hypothetical protein [Streptomyces avermitilis]GDY61986.1 hypothetical protein SAV14893_013790 [Streptomyces avermitilis]
MLSGFVTDVGRKLAERWAATLVLPGLLFTTVAAVALTLRQSAWSDVDLLRLRVTALTGAGSGRAPARARVRRVRRCCCSVCWPRPSPPRWWPTRSAGRTNRRCSAAGPAS